MSKTKRKIFEIANDIRDSWKEPPAKVVPYLEAMSYLEDIEQVLYGDYAISIVKNFLDFSRSWTGPEAVRLKKELRNLLPKVKK